MKRILGCVVVALLLVALFLSAQNGSADEYAQGKKLYSNHCQICHGANGKGDGPAAITLSPRPANFTDPKFWTGDVDEKISETIKNGHGPMPPFELKPDEIKAIIDYISRTFKK